MKGPARGDELSSRNREKKKKREGLTAGVFREYVAMIRERGKKDDEG